LKKAQFGKKEKVEKLKNSGKERLSLIKLCLRPFQHGVNE